MSATTVPTRHLRADMIDKRFEILDLVRDTDQPLDAVRDDPNQLETLTVLLNASYSLLSHAKAIAETDGAAMSPHELALIRVMTGELDGQTIDVDDLRYATDALMRPPGE